MSWNTLPEKNPKKLKTFLGTTIGALVLAVLAEILLVFLLKPSIVGTEPAACGMGLFFRYLTVYCEPRNSGFDCIFGGNDGIAVNLYKMVKEYLFLFAIILAIQVFCRWLIQKIRKKDNHMQM